MTLCVGVMLIFKTIFHLKGKQNNHCLNLWKYNPSLIRKKKLQSTLHVSGITFHQVQVRITFHQVQVSS